MPFKSTADRQTWRQHNRALQWLYKERHKLKYSKPPKPPKPPKVLKKKRYATREEAMIARRERDRLRHIRDRGKRIIGADERKRNAERERKRRERLKQNGDPSFIEKAKRDQKRLDERRRNDPQEKLSHAMRRRLRNALQAMAADKSAHTEELTGCSWVQLKVWLEAHMLPGMTWENYGTKWHVDHRVECCRFDLTREDEQRRCFHFSNLRPMWAKANLRRKRAGISAQPGLGI